MTDSKTDDAPVPGVPKESVKTNKGLNHEQADEAQTVADESQTDDAERSSASEAPRSDS